MLPTINHPYPKMPTIQEIKAELTKMNVEFSSKGLKKADYEKLLADAKSAQKSKKAASKGKGKAKAVEKSASKSKSKGKGKGQGNGGAKAKAVEKSASKSKSKSKVMKEAESKEQSRSSSRSKSRARGVLLTSVGEEEEVELNYETCVNKFHNDRVRKMAQEQGVDIKGKRKAELCKALGDRAENSRKRKASYKTANEKKWEKSNAVEVEELGDLFANNSNRSANVEAAKMKANNRSNKLSSSIGSGMKWPGTA